MTETGDTAERPRDGALRVPEPRPGRQRRSALSRVLYSLFIALILAALLGVGLMAYGYATYNAAGPLASDKTFEVRQGLDAPAIAGELQRADIISDSGVFTAAVAVTGARGDLKAGEYKFPARASMREVLDIIVAGKAILYKLTIPEGWTTDQALTRIREHPILAGTLSVTPPEGALLPNTYVFRRDKSRDQMVHDMVEAQDRLLAELWARRNPDIPVKTPQEAVVLASIVEKETAIAAERPRVAGVFANRLKRGMRLQSDPTIIYGITLGKGKLGRSLTRADIATSTPYNTYRISGLPPGPIANPGRPALEAVLNPIASKDLYFVADGSGGHAFAETLEQHNANVAKWRKIEQADDAPPPAATAAAPDPAAAAPPAPAAIPEPLPETAAALKAVVDPPRPKTVEKPPAPAIAAVAPEPAAVPQPPEPGPVAADPKPGTVVKVANRLVPIPVPKPKSP